MTIAELVDQLLVDASYQNRHRGHSKHLRTAATVLQKQQTELIALRKELHRKQQRIYELDTMIELMTAHGGDLITTRTRIINQLLDRRAKATDA